MTDAPEDVETVRRALDAGAPGRLEVDAHPWTYALELRSLAGLFGYFVVTGRTEPSGPEQFLLRVLGQQAGIALANARLHARERQTAEELRVANAALADTVAALEHSTAIHDRLTRAGVSGGGEQGIADAVHELTGYPVVVEDRHGNLRVTTRIDNRAATPEIDQVLAFLRDFAEAITKEAVSHLSRTGPS